ncbi:hypothetical protein BGZ94_003404 [Podila epigama]|nr:hypothetical protein BGZ94_003404 [Podila epigama]
MPLLKSIAAQIESTGSRSIRVHLICTFRYESELYSYGDFMHRITHDTRFTSWLRTDIHITRSNPTTIVSPPPPSGDGNPDTKQLSGSSSSSSSSSDNSETTSIATAKLLPITSNTSPENSTTTKDTAIGNDVDRYVNKPLPTFIEANSASASTLHARRDMFLTSFILIVPAIIFIGARFVPWEGSWNGEWRWCRTTRIYDQNMTNKCMWNYTMTPGVVHIAAASFFGYFGLWYARRRNRGPVATSTDDDDATETASVSKDNVKDEGVVMAPLDIEQQSEHMQAVLESQVQVMDGSIVYKSGRLNIEQSIQELVDAQVGMVQNKKTPEKLTAVFVGGPDSFLDSVQDLSKRAPWTVNFHRETWSP